MTRTVWSPRLWLAAIGCAVLVAVAAPISRGFAQDMDPNSDESAEDPAESRAAAFRAVEGPEAESVPGGVLMISAYSAAWVFLLLYVLRLGMLSSRTASDVARLEKTLAQKASAGAKD